MTIKKSKSEFAPSSILGKIVFFGILVNIFVIVLELNTDLKIEGDLAYGGVISIFLLPFLGSIVAWKNSEPEKDGFFSKFTSLFTRGLWFAVFSVIALIIGAITFDNANDLNNSLIGAYVIFLISFLFFWLSIGFNIKGTGNSDKRGLADAVAMSLGQILILFFILLLLGAIAEKFKKNN